MKCSLRLSGPVIELIATALFAFEVDSEGGLSDSLEAEQSNRDSHSIITRCTKLRDFTINQPY